MASSATPSSLSTTIASRKTSLRASLQNELLSVTLPDSRFHNDLSSFIPDFDGSSTATQHLVSHRLFQDASVLFITPDNCLEELRLVALHAGKTVIVTTYGIRRGFYLLDPRIITSETDRLRASLLDSMEKVGQHITPEQLLSISPPLKIDLLITGTFAVDVSTGVRFGKGHGFFDLEWAMLSSLNLVADNAQIITLCHDLQAVNEGLEADEWDTVTDYVVTPSGMATVDGQKKVARPSRGIIWSRVSEEMMDEMPVLKELKEMSSK